MCKKKLKLNILRVQYSNYQLFYVTARLYLTNEWVEIIYRFRTVLYCRRFDLSDSITLMHRINSVTMLSLWYHEIAHDIIPRYIIIILLFGDCLTRIFSFLVATQGSVALDSSRSRTVTGTTIVSSAPRVRPHWWVEASSPTAKTSFARNAQNRSSCKLHPLPERYRQQTIIASSS